MRARELIVKLRKILREEGDIEILLPDGTPLKKLTVETVPYAREAEERYE